MQAVSSLRTRIFLACTLLTALSLGIAFYFVHARASTEAEAEVRRGLTEAAALVDRHRAVRSDTFTRMARLVADLPRLKAAVETGDPPTVQPIAAEYRDQMQADVLVLTGADGQVLGIAGSDAHAVPLAGTPATAETSTFHPHPRGLLHVVGVPILLGPAPEVLGRLTAAFLMDDALAAEFRALTGSEIAFAADGRVLASSLPAGRRAVLEPVLATRAITPVLVGEEDYLAVARPMVHTSAADAHDAAAPSTLILRSRTERLRFLATVRTGLIAALVVTILAATVLSYAVARTMTRPLAAVTSAMADVAATGDLTRKVSLQGRSWADADARLLAGSFNTLTESIARFQREAAQRERLSSLGRLSTVVAHEIRNPLMIIRASLRQLRRDGATAADVREAAADIDEETRRLDRIVTEVLDFARPIRFQLAPADINEICRTSAAAVWPEEAQPPVRFDLDATLPVIVTDDERLRTALVNVLANARQALDARSPVAAGVLDATAGPATAGPGTAPVVVATGRTGAGRVSIVVRDSGAGIGTDDLLHIFDPYFTTRRAGTGLGLPIAKNIVEGLGGSIAVTSSAGAGTEIRIDLPSSPAGAAT